MDKKENNNSEYFTIDIMQILRTLWHRAWIILLVSVLVGASTLVVNRFFVRETYAASVMMYVNNKVESTNTGNQSSAISQSDMTAKKELVKTYAVILKSNKTLQHLIDYTGINRTCAELKDMISAQAVNETEVFQVTVKSNDRAEATKIAKAVAEILPEHIKEIIIGSETKPVDDLAESKKVAPNITQNTIIGAMLGFLGSCVLFVVIAMLDDTIRNEDYVAQNYDVPILAKIPDLMMEEPTNRKYAYYKKYKSSSYYKKPDDPQASEEKR